MAVMASRALGDLWSVGVPSGTGGTQRERAFLYAERKVVTLAKVHPGQCKAMVDLTQD